MNLDWIILIKLGGGQVHETLSWLLTDWLGRGRESTVGSTIPGKVGLSGIRRWQSPLGREPVGSVPPWFLPQVPVLSSLSEGRRPGSDNWNKPFPPQIVLVKMFHHSNTKQTRTIYSIVVIHWDSPRLVKSLRESEQPWGGKVSHCVSWSWPQSPEMKVPTVEGKPGWSLRTSELRSSHCPHRLCYAPGGVFSTIVIGTHCFPVFFFQEGALIAFIFFFPYPCIAYVLGKKWEKVI